MKQVMVRYTVKPEEAANNEKLVRAVYQELHRSQRTGLRYATFQLEDGVTFVHIAQFEDGRDPLAQVKAFKEFQKGIRKRCVDPPVVSELSAIGAFGPAFTEAP